MNKEEIIKKIKSTKNYLKRWKNDTDDQIIKNHVSSIFSDLNDIENMINEDEQNKNNYNIYHSEQSCKIVDGSCMMCGDVADTKDGWVCKDCRKY